MGSPPPKAHSAPAHDSPAHDSPAQDLPELAVYGGTQRFATIGEVIAAARRKLSAEILGYVEGGASGEDTLALNRAAFAGWNFSPRMLAGISRPDLASSLFGIPLTMPVFTAPFGNDGAIASAGYLAVAEAAGQFGITCVAPEGSTYSYEDIAARSAGQQGMAQLTLVGPDSHVAGLVERAAAAGYRAVCFTDAPVRAWRERLRESRLDLMSQFGMANYGPGKADVAVLRELVAFTERRWDWQRLARFARTCPLPWVLKGVLGAEEARRAVGIGAAGVYVSNYGGRDLDGLPASLDRLPGRCRCCSTAASAAARTRSRRWRWEPARWALAGSRCTVSRRTAPGASAASASCSRQRWRR
jgi:4-hydroxymandelate oxidase